MNTTKLTTLVQAVQSVKSVVRHAHVGGMSRGDIFNRHILPVTVPAKKEYQVASRAMLANAIEQALDGRDLSFDLAPIATMHVDLTDAIEAAYDSCGAVESDKYRLAFLNFSVTGADGQSQFTDFADRSSVLKLLRSMTPEELTRLVWSLRGGINAEWAKGVTSKLSEALDRLNIWSYDIESGITHENAREWVMAAATSRANIGKPSALNVLMGQETKPGKIAGGLKAIALVVVKQYALKERTMREIRENARIRAEAGYVRKTAGMSYLVESKDGDRPGSASGRDTATDIDYFREEVSSSNYDALDEFISTLLEIYEPMEKYMGTLPAFMTESTTYPARELRKAFEARVKAWDDYFRSLEDKGEGYRDRMVAAHLQAADEMAKRRAESRRSRIEDLLS